MGKIHKIKQGDSVASLADAAGHFPGTIWDHPENSALRSRRDNMNILAEEDELFIPDVENKMLPCKTEMRHRFRRVGVPALYRVQLLLNGEPRKNLKSLLVVEGIVYEGATDEQGMIEVFVPPSTKEIQLFIGDEEYPRILQIGDLEPVDSIPGVQQRLRNLGYDCPASGSLDEATRAALWAFQQSMEIPPTGDPDSATLSMLRRAHDNLGGEI